MTIRSTFNPKRRLQESPDPRHLDALAGEVGYGGNPEHKSGPGDFHLSPPAQPRADKTLCDVVGIFQRSVAEDLLRQGIAKGLVSVQKRGTFPQNIWSVTTDGHPLEAELENSVRGTYHGYPMPGTDPFRRVVLRRWRGE